MKCGSLKRYRAINLIIDFIFVKQFGLEENFHSEQFVEGASYTPLKNHCSLHINYQSALAQTPIISSKLMRQFKSQLLINAVTRRCQKTSPYKQNNINTVTSVVSHMFLFISFQVICQKADLFITQSVIQFFKQKIPQRFMLTDFLTLRQ